ncbi:long-chain-fatty-acid--CoA ligase [Sphingomonas nostoxanthinifaciens]|uniref:long-chain-fatty-acid--CoA ligase n=1 Tax=Sphingomonas nostoxanthinifaciens TaxID=2872652 RepID=UPI001CC1D27F|nr:long-chain fatty acid--CoA ligase [Sphingomonas nostoxanthinifaciens]UAK24507.1 long-chain fatty acid--CoA ligase [Sphingomonas nostoxanthinifaciens]
MGAAAMIGATQADDALAPPPIAPRRLTDLLDRAVAQHGTRVAIDFMGRRWTYGELGAEVSRATRGLQDIGVTPGTRVGLCLPSCPFFVIFYFAILRAGGVVVNFNPLYVERELRHQITDSGTHVMIVPDLKLIHEKVVALAAETGLDHIVVCPMTGMLPPMKALGFRLFKRKDQARVPEDAVHVLWADLVAGDAAPDPVVIRPDDLAVLQYTGGTTGVPKGAMLTHANLAANSAQMVVHVGHPPETQERTLGVLPLFHVFALTCVLNYSVDTAAEMILLPRFDMKSFLATAKRTRPTQFFGVPTLYNALSRMPRPKLAALGSVRVCISGGAPLPLEIRHAFETATGVRVVEGYGLSEAAPIIACNPLDGVVKDNSCGPAFPATVLEIRDLTDPTRLLPQGERGEVCVRGPQVMTGYWNRPEDTRAVFIDGALRTGDVGYFDADGYLFLVDRIKDLILCGGYNVYPRIIEDALYEHPAVAEAVVIGVPDGYRGQAPKAFVALKPGEQVTTETLCTFLKDRLNKIEMPREIELRDSLPKTLIGKLSKKELVAEEAARAAALQ